MRLFICSVVLALAAVAIGQTTKQEKHFLDQVIRAFQEKDTKAFLSLYCWDRVDKFTRDTLAENLAEIIGDPLNKAELKDPDPDLNFEPYTRNGITYTTNLGVIKMLKLTFNDDPDLSHEYLIGMKDSKFMIVTAAPVLKK